MRQGTFGRLQSPGRETLPNTSHGSSPDDVSLQLIDLLDRQLQNDVSTVPTKGVERPDQVSPALLERRERRAGCDGLQPCDVLLLIVAPIGDD